MVHISQVQENELAIVKEKIAIKTDRNAKATKAVITNTSIKAKGKGKEKEKEKPKKKSEKKKK